MPRIRNPESRIHVLQLRVSESELSAIDSERGKLSRSEFIRRQLDREGAERALAVYAGLMRLMTGEQPRMPVPGAPGLWLAREDQLTWE
jgi:hypothetical protein